MHVPLASTGVGDRVFLCRRGRDMQADRSKGPFMRRICTLGLALALIAAVATPAAAQKYPARTVSVIVPYPAGGSVDGVARILVQKLNETVGQHFIVENRAGGASGMVGANAVARAAPDGYTLMVSASVHVINPFLYKNHPVRRGEGFHAGHAARRRTADRLHHAERHGQQPQGFLRASAQGADQIHLRHHQPRLRQPSCRSNCSSATPGSIRW